MCPYVAGLCVNPDDGLEALDGGQGRTVAKVEEVVVLQPLGKADKKTHSLNVFNINGHRLTWRNG